MRPLKIANNEAREKELLREFSQAEDLEIADLLEPVDDRLRNVRGMWGRLYDQAVRIAQHRTRAPGIPE